ncbi:MAG: hypothetical protein JRJ11_14485 [Deltaproteobacteria bacterium]|nr:hypothetical protein [Deltaproteobacteria bacterium]MBW2034902.1 hypothetical protein [Deltaproteobacteria bacterium]
MNYNEFLERIKELDFEELREDQPEYMEFVIATNHLNRLSSILESYYGAAYASPEEQPSKQAQKYADPNGGIRKGQTLYYLKSGEVFHCALLWPWGDRKSTTIKFFQGEKKGTGTRTERVWQRITRLLFNR